MTRRNPEPDDAWALNGRLAFAEVTRRYQESLGWYRTSGLPEAVDLGALEYTDSSALALLLEWQSWARREGRRLKFLNPPEGLRVYADLTDSAELLGWGERASS